MHSFYQPSFTHFDYDLILLSLFTCLINIPDQTIVDNFNVWLSQEVYDKDTFSLDDPMGNAEFDIQPFVEVLKMNLANVPNGTVITKVSPTRQNCLAEESPIYWSDGKVIQDLVLRLRNVECGEIELQLRWVNVPGSKGL